MTETAQNKAAIAVPPNCTPAAPPKSNWVARTMFSIIAFTTLFGLITLGWQSVANLDEVILAELIARHGPAVVGIPIAATFATSIVAGLRAIEGKLHAKVFGVRAKGAAAVLLSWIAVFSVLTLAIRMLW